MHPEKSLAIAVVDKIRLHYHKKLTEIYTIIKGTLIFHSGDKNIVLKEKESVRILPGQIHWAEGNETWIYVSSTPGWIPEDHILAIDDQELSRKEFDKRFHN